MIKPFLILSLILTSSVIFAQERFYYLYDGWEISKVFVIENNYLSCGLCTHSSTNASNLQFSIINSEGTCLDSFSYSDETDGYTVHRAGSYLISGDTLLIVGSAVDYYKNYYLNRRLFKYNLVTKEMCEIIDYTHCGEGQALNYLITDLNNGYVISSEYNYIQYNQFPMLIFTNIIGDTISTKRYAFLPTDEIGRRVKPYQLLKLPDGGYVLTCEDEIGQYMYQEQRAWFLRLDSDGNELWRRATSTQDTMCYRPFAFLTQNNDYIITWSDPELYEEVLNPARTLWLAKMSDNGVISGRHKISDDIEDLSVKRYYVNDYYQDSMGNVFLMGEMAYPYCGILIKINPQGHAVWIRSYTCFPENEVSGAYTKLYGLTPTPDGGFIMGGEYMSPNSAMFPGGIQKGLAIKVDSCGCLEEGCNPLCNVSIGQQFITSEKVSIYPNPSTDLVYLELNTFAKNINIQVFDAEECLWINTFENSELNNHAKISLDVSGLAAGFYTVNIWADGKLFRGKFVKIGE